MDWDYYFFSLVDLIAQKSKDPSTKSGCIIVGPDDEIRSTGYNGLPRGCDDDLPERNERPTKYLWYEHAERNAIYNACRVGFSLKNCRMYINWFPCADCARAIIQCGIKEIIIKDNPDEERDKRWENNHKVAKEMFKETKVKIRYWRDD